MRSFTLRTALTALAVASALGPARSDGEIAIRDARIVTGDGTVIERGNIVVSGSRIAAAGPDAAIPPGAQVIDGAGLTVYPGLIDAFCLAGIPAPPAAQSQPQPPARSGQQRRGQQAAPPPRPAAPLVWRKATEGFNTGAAALQGLRNNGFTAALLGTRGVLTPGENALVTLAPGEVAAMVLKDRVAVNVNTLSRGSAYPGTLMGAYAFLKQALYDGIDQRNRKPENPDTRLDALGMAASGQIPLIYAAHTENDIKRALKLGKEFSARLVILGGRDSEKVLPLLKERETPVILTEDWLPAIALSKAGIPFALASNKIEMTSAEANDMRDKLTTLVEKGLSPELALTGLTRTPAALLGVGSEMGMIKPGMLANLAVVEGDLTKKDGKVKFALIRGRRVDSAPVTAEGPKAAQVAEDGRPYVNVYEDDVDDHGDGGAR